MPALVIFKNLTTRPFAGDDLQILCLIQGFFRFLQMGCLIPVLINALIKRVQGRDLIIDGYGSHCPQYYGYSASDLIVVTVDQIWGGVNVTRDRFGMIFTWLSAFYLLIDVTWMCAVWSACSVGTPTQSMGRDKYLRPLIIFKMLAVNIFPITLLVFGVLKVAGTRKNNYGCGEETPLRLPDSGVIYTLFCILLVTYSLELLIWPAIVANKFIRCIKSGSPPKKLHWLGIGRNTTKAKGERLEKCLGIILKCVQYCCCNKAGGKELKDTTQLRDFATNFMEFANNSTKVDVVLSDMYVGLKMLSRVQGERRLIAIQNMHKTSMQHKEEAVDTLETESKSTKQNDSNLRSLLVTTAPRRRSVLTLQTDDDGKDYVVIEKNLLTTSNPEDVNTLQKAAHFSIYAAYIYFCIRDVALLDFGLEEDSTNFLRDIEAMIANSDGFRFRLSSVGIEHAQLCYGNFFNGIYETPYAILLDDKEKSVVITVRGTNSLEDWVIDLQYIPVNLKDVGELCGFNGEGHHCHKGVLSRCKWIYNDLKKRRVLKSLYSNNSIYSGYNLVVVGHSLGGGCATVLSLMLRPSFPSLKCYAYEPPGCIFDDVLARECEGFITSIVRQDDLVPRITQSNLEMMRDEFFDVIARIKVPKIKAFQDVRSPCPDAHLAQRNAKILLPKGQAPRDTSFYQQIREFRAERATKNQIGETSIKLYIPGKIVHLVDTKGDESKYVPYYASRYEFNQVVLSGRMISDHDIPSLVRILRDISLDDLEECIAFKTETNNDSEEKEAQINMFICCSYPHGKGSFSPLASSVIAFFLSIMSNNGCRFAARSTTILYPDGSSASGLGLSVGLYSYSLKKCIDPESCDYMDPSDLEDSLYCQVYPQNISRDPNWVVSMAFSTLAIIFGFGGLIIISVTTCTRLKRSLLKAVCVLFLVATFCQGMQFLFFKSDLCNEWVHPDELYSSQAECNLSNGGFVGIAATIFWFISAVGSSYMIATY